MREKILSKIKSVLKERLLVVVCFFILIVVCATYYVIENGDVFKPQKLVLSQKNNGKDSTSSGEGVLGDDQDNKEAGDELVVDVSGAVVNPGVYRIDPNSRIGDAVKAAGGISSSASAQFAAKNINFAEKIEDSEKIYIPFEWETYQEEEYNLISLVIEPPKNTSSSTTGASNANTNSNSGTGGTSTANSGQLASSSQPSSQTSTKINVNKATLTELDSLSGIGPSYAQRIIDNRSYKNYEELISKSKVPKTTLEKIKNEITY